MQKVILILSLVFLFLQYCSIYDKNPYRKHRLVELDNDNGFITKYYFPLGRTDSVRVYLESIQGEYDYNKPIFAYSLRNTNEDMFLVDHKSDTLILYYKNSNLKISKYMNNVLNLNLSFRLISTKEFLDKKKKLWSKQKNEVIEITSD